MRNVLAVYEIDNDRFPTTRQGLDALVRVPTVDPMPAQWKKMLDCDEIPRDPWGREYFYRCPGVRNPNAYDLVCLGEDGVLGTKDDIER